MQTGQCPEAGDGNATDFHVRVPDACEEHGNRGRAALAEGVHGGAPSFGGGVLQFSGQGIPGETLHGPLQGR